jgi:hypothetical protein
MKVRLRWELYQKEEFQPEEKAKEGPLKKSVCPNL